MPKRFYPVGYPLWRLFARLGFTLKIRVDIVRDPEAGVFVATSRDLQGLVCESETLDSLRNDIRRATNALLSVAYYPSPAPPHITELRQP